MKNGSHQANASQLSATHPTWAGLRLLSVDGVVWRTPDTDDNHKHYGSASNQHGDTGYPQVRMVCQMELTSHMLVSSAFAGYHSNEMKLAELQASAMHYVLPHRREDHSYPRVVKPKPSKYPTRNKNASQLN